MSAMINCMREAVGAVEAHMKSLGPSSGGVQFPDALLKQMKTHAQTSVDLLAKTEKKAEGAEEL